MEPLRLLSFHKKRKFRNQMKKSLSYRITLFVIKLKGLKKIFSQNPIDHKKLKKEDVHQPKGNPFKSERFSQFNHLETRISELKPTSPSGKLILFIHGGAFVSGPAKHHWDTIKTIGKETNATIWMIDYPKAPEHKIRQISKNIDAAYTLALEKYKDTEIQLIGDSVGGTLIAALTQRLVEKGKPLPSKIILISPVMDASMSNPEIDTIDQKDPVLSKPGVLSAKKMCAENHDLAHPMISPVNGSFHGFPKTILFMAENDIAYPDQQRTVTKLKEANIDLTVHVGKEMPHIWPILPVMKEAKIALNEIIRVLK